MNKKIHKNKVVCNFPIKINIFFFLSNIESYILEFSYFSCLIVFVQSQYSCTCNKFLCVRRKSSCACDIWRKLCHEFSFRFFSDFLQKLYHEHSFPHTKATSRSGKFCASVWERKVFLVLGECGVRWMNTIHGKYVHEFLWNIYSSDELSYSKK